MNQHEREDKMFDLGFSRLTEAHEIAEAGSYASSSPLVTSAMFKQITEAARVIQKRYLEVVDKQHAKEDKCLVGVVDLYAQLKPEPRFGDEELYPFALIAAVLWKTLLDHAFIPDKVRTDREIRMRAGEIPRLKLKTELGKMLYLQHRVLHYRDMSKTLGDEPDLKRLLNNLQRSVMDSGATLPRRMQRATGPYNELDRAASEDGVLVVRRGPNAIGKQLRIPTEIKHRWEDDFKEFIGIALLNIFCIPKGEVAGVDDQRFFTIDSTNHKSGDCLRPTEAFKRQLIEAPLKQLNGKVIDFLPLVEPPADWSYLEFSGSENKTGGYHTSSVREIAKLVRTSQGENQSVPSELAVDFINNIQRTEWVIDEEQFELVKRIGRNWHVDYDGIQRPPSYTSDDVENSTGNARLLPQVIYRNENALKVLPLLKRLKAKDHLTDSEKETINRWNLNNAKLAETYRSISDRSKQFKAFTTFLNRVDESIGMPIWFAWSFDYRTRVYPIGAQGTPQGPPFERHSLCFANGQRLDEGGKRSALIAIGGAAIGTKGSIEGRHSWSTQHMDLIRFIAEGTDASLEEAAGWDEPLYLIQLCRHWVRHEQGGLWSAPIYADATCSGYQIVSALLNNKEGLFSTNCLAATEQDEPQDAYSEVIQLVVNRLMAKQKKDPDKFKLSFKGITTEERVKILDMISDYDPITESYRTNSRGRQISKCVARTMIYGSSPGTQLRDINKELEKRKITLEKFPGALRSVLLSEITSAYTAVLGSVNAFNMQIKKAALERLSVGCDEQLMKDMKEMTSKRAPRQRSGKDLNRKDMNQMIQMGRDIKGQTTYGCKFTTVDGSVIDMANYVKSVEILQTTLHGKPSAPITHIDSLDPQSIVQATPPGLIHSIDASILKFAYVDWEHPISCVHDSAGCLPNQFDEMKRRYRMGFLKATEQNALVSLWKEWGIEGKPELDSTDTGWRDEVMNATYLFN